MKYLQSKEASEDKINVLFSNNTSIIGLADIFGLNKVSKLPHLFNVLMIQKFRDNDVNMEFVKLVWNNKRIKVIS